MWYQICTTYKQGYPKGQATLAKALGLKILGEKKVSKNLI